MPSTYNRNVKVCIRTDHKDNLHYMEFIIYVLNLFTMNCFLIHSFKGIMWANLGF